MARRRRRRTTVAGGLGGLLIVLLAGAGVVLRTNPALQSQLPPAVRTAINSINLPTGIPETSQPTGGVQPAANAQIGARTKTSGCQVLNALQDRACTPGAIFA